MPPFRKKIDRSEMLQFGPFWYPIDFYALADSNITGPALKRHFEFQLAMENYDYLLGIRNVNKRNAMQFCFRFVTEDAPQKVNVGFDDRQLTLEAVGDLFPPEGQLSRMKKRKRDHARQAAATGANAGNGAPAMVHKPTVTRDAVKNAFSATTNALYELVTADFIGNDKGGKFWQSKMFKDLHKWRLDHYYRRHLQKTPAVRLADESLAAAQQERRNNVGVGGMMMTADMAAAWEDLMGS